MERYNYSLLLGRMKERGFTQEKMAKELGISACSMNLSLNNKRNFRQDEILKISTLLDIAGKDVESYFFTHAL